MKIFNSIKESVKKYIFEQRNYAISAGYQMIKSPKPIYTNWTVANAVKEGYQVNAWVYRSVYLKAKAGSSVPWYVVDAEGERIDGHPITELFKRPNPSISRQDLFELIISWLELSGNSYLKKIIYQGRTTELWPISPDRCHPVPSTDPCEWLAGYALDKSKVVTLEPSEIIHHKYFNPANPLLGIAPLQAVAKTTDIDNSQKDFNKSTTQNRGVVDGIFVFDKAFNTQAESDAVRDRLNETHANRKTFGVLGAGAKYIRTALTPDEMDFIESRKANREEIFIAFGVPPVYAGVMDGATMNNYKTSELIFWFGTMLFLLDDLKDTFNFSLYDEIGEGNELVYDITGVPAIREALLAKTKTAKQLFEMGVPFEQLNKIFEFGFEEFEGWEKSNVIASGGTSGGTPSEEITNDSATRSSVKKKFNLLPIMEQRSEVRGRLLEDTIEKHALENQKKFEDILSTMQESVFDGLTINSTEDDITALIGKTATLFKDLITEIYVSEGVVFGSEMVVERRSVDLNAALSAEIENYLKSEGSILKEISLINATTVEKILKQIASTIETGSTLGELQQAIIDTGIFNEKRALMLARTLTGTAANLGQFKGAALGGANQKTWITAGFEVRKTHQALDGVTIPIDESFNVGGEKADFPLELRLSPKERCNCRCTLVYSADASQQIIEDLKKAQKEKQKEVVIEIEELMTKAEKKAALAKVKKEYNKILAKIDADMDNLSSKQVMKAYEKAQADYDAAVAGIEAGIKGSEDLIKVAKKVKQKDIKKWKEVESIDEATKKFKDLLNVDIELVKYDVVDDLDFTIEQLNWTGKHLTNLIKGDKGLEDFFNKNMKDEAWDLTLVDAPSIELLADGKLKYVNGYASGTKEIAIAMGDVESNDFLVGEWTTEKSLKGTMTHEFGHKVHQTLSEADQAEWLKISNSISGTEKSRNISTYSTTNEKEFFAECFAAKYNGNTKSILNEKVSTFFKEKIK